MSQKLRELSVFGVLFALPFAGAFAVEPWAAFLLCPLGVVGLLGLNETLGDLRKLSPRRFPREETRP
jgi:hypothetical protein